MKPFPLYLPLIVTGSIFSFMAAQDLSAQITRRSDPVAQKLNKWGAEGTAAGVAAFQYENRDGGHSPFPLADWPLLKAFEHSLADTQANRTMGPAQQVRMFPIFGNSSMSAAADKGGSLPRFYMMNRNGFNFLSTQYLNNNMYFYPEHQDYDKGYNGLNGWNDMYPANVPCLVISQGSSYTDMPFMQAFVSTAAAFNPITQDALIKSKLLAPTLQNIFRRSNRMLQTDEEYFTGKAHPPVFDGAQINEDKMVELAHAMTPALIPPVAILEVTGETGSTLGRDYFEGPNTTSEVLGNTPVAIARVFRGSSLNKSMTISAKKSADLMRRPLTFRWEILQGDPKRIKIEPGADGSEAKLTVSWHPELTAATGISSQRVDIGVFVGNGTSWSTPSFITFYMLPNEARYYDESGRLLEVQYEAGNPDWGLPATTELRWLSLARKIGNKDTSPGVTLLNEVLSEEARTRFKQMADDLAPAQNSWREFSRDSANKGQADAAQQQLQAAVSQHLGVPTTDGRPLWESAWKGLITLSERKDLYLARQDQMANLADSSTKQSAAGDLAAARLKLVNLGVLQRTAQKGFTLTSTDREPTPGETGLLRSFHLILLSQVLFPDFMERSSAPAFVDGRLTALKDWRDVHRYDASGTWQGWTRYGNSTVHEFDATGQQYPGGRDGQPVPVTYTLDTATNKLTYRVSRD